MVLTRRKKSFSSGSNNPMKSPRKTTEEIKERSSSSHRLGEKQKRKPDDVESDVSSSSDSKETQKREAQESSSDIKFNKLEKGLFRPPKKINKPSPLRLHKLKYETNDINNSHKKKSESSSRGQAFDMQVKTELKNVLPSTKNLPRKWSPSSEIVLCRCMAEFKPAGIHKHFHMANICYNFNKNNGQPRTAREIWTYLNSLYDLQAIDEREFLPPDEWSIFPERQLDLQAVKEFVLPDSQFKTLKVSKSKNKV